MSHYYDAAGGSFHTIKGKNGKDRPVKISDARTLGLYPSVTTILDILSKPQLDSWKQKQVAYACLRAACIPGPNDDKEAWASLVIADAFKQVEDAADLGTNIHAAIEAHFKGQPFTAELSVYVNAVDKWVRENGIEFAAHELRLVNQDVGYAGTTDAAIRSARGFGICDFKTRKSVAGRPMEAYDGQATQISAYHVAHYKSVPTIDSHVAGLNLFISTTEPGRVEGVWHDAATLAQEWEFFVHLCACWRIRKGYDPRPKTDAAPVAAVA